MSMTIGEIADIIEKLAPQEQAEAFDNVGLLAGRRDKRIDRVMTALDATEAAIAKAEELGAGLIATHHPLMIKPVAAVTDRTVTGKKLLRLIEQGIAVYAAHTNLDKAPGGLNRLFGETVGLKEIQDWDGVEASGFIKTGLLDAPMTLEAFASSVKEALGSSHALYAGEAAKPVRKVAFCSGSGMSLMQEAIASGADVYLTGDLKYHDALDAEEAGFAVVDATHFSSEKLAVRVLADWIRQHAGDRIEVIEYNGQRNPMRIV